MRGDEFLVAEYPDPGQRARAVKWLGWIACHGQEGEPIEWWAIPSWVPAVKPLTVRRLVAWAVLAGMAGIAVAFTPWAAIVFGVAAASAVVQAVFVVMSGAAAPPVLRPGAPWAVAFRMRNRREVVELVRSGAWLAARTTAFLIRHCFWPPVIRPGADRAVVNRPPWAADSDGRAVTYRDAGLTSLLAAAAGLLGGALLAAFTLWPAYGSPGWPAATALFMAGAAMSAWLLAGRYPLLWLCGLMLGGPGLRFGRLLEEATERRVLRRSGVGYLFRDEEVRARLIALSLPELVPEQAGQAGQAASSGIGARPARLPRATAHKIAADISIGAWVAMTVGLFVIGQSVHDPFWLPVLLAAGFAVMAWTKLNGLLRETLGGIASSARWRQEHIAGLGPLRACIVVIIGGAAAWMLVIAAGPDLAGILARVLPALFVAACGTWAWALAEGKARRSWPPAAGHIADVVLIATTAATGLISFRQGLLTTAPAAALLFPPALGGAVLIWRAMSSSRDLAVSTAADITLSLLLGAELVIFLVWLANMIGLPWTEMSALRGAAHYAGSVASLPWWTWTVIYVLLAGASLAFMRWPGKLARQIRWFERLRLVSATGVARRVLTGAHIGLLVIVLVGAVGPAALGSALRGQLKNAYLVAFQRNLEAAGELAAYHEIRREYLSQPPDPTLTSIVWSVYGTDDPAAGAGITSTQASVARRVGELQAVTLAADAPPELRDRERSAARAAGFDEPAGSVADLGDRAGAVQREEHVGDKVASQAEAAGELAASAIASTMSIPHISANAVVQIVAEYLSGLIEGSPLKDKLAAWAEHVPGGEDPEDAALAVVPDPEELRTAAAAALSEQYEKQGLEAPDAAGDSADSTAQSEDTWIDNDQEADPDVVDAVDLADRAQQLQDGADPCSSCVRVPPPGEEDGVPPGEDDPDEP